ncbi:MAG: efflux RND transporter periplasmic adaptor subunit [Bacteroidota bacterium]
MKKSVIYISLSVVILAGAFTAFKLSGKVRPVAELETVSIGRGDLSNITTATGTLEAIETVEVGTQVSGVIDHIYVDFNSEVKRGQILAKLDETPLLASLEQSKATVDNAQAELDYQKANYERIRILAEKNLIAESDFELAQYNYRKAEASLKNAQSVYDKNKINLAYATIYSPIDGIVLDRAVDEGQTVAASFSTPTLFTIVQDLTKMQVEASVAEADIGSIRQGQRVEFTVDAYPDLSFGGEVTQIRLQPVESANVITYTVIIDAPNPDKKLMPGMTANVSFYVTEKKNILLVPAQAIWFTPEPAKWEAYLKNHPEMSVDPGPQQDQGVPPASSQELTSSPLQNAEADRTNEKTVWVVNGNHISPRKIKTGDTDEMYYELLSGLNEGDLLVSSVSSSETVSTVKESEARSPFMPQRPGSNKK